MPWFTLHRNFSMSTTAGHIIDFKKGEKTWVPPAVVPNAVAIGALPVDGAVDVIPPEQQSKTQPVGEERKKIVFDAFEKMMLRNQRADFSASGQPNAKRLEEITGFMMAVEERDTFWKEYVATREEAK